MPDGIAKRDRALAQIDELMAVLQSRKESYRRRRPAIVNLIAAAEMERFLRNGLVGRLDLPDKTRRGRRALARAEAEHFTALMENEPIGVQIGIVRDTLPHTSFQIFRQPDRRFGAKPVPPRRGAQYPHRRRHDHLGARSAGAARNNGARALGQRAQRPGRGALHAGHDGEIILHRESGGGDHP